MPPSAPPEEAPELETPDRGAPPRPPPRRGEARRMRNQIDYVQHPKTRARRVSSRRAQLLATSTGLYNMARIRMVSLLWRNVTRTGDVQGLEIVRGAGFSGEPLPESLRTTLAACARELERDILPTPEGLLAQREYHLAMAESIARRHAAMLGGGLRPPSPPPAGGDEPEGAARAPPSEPPRPTELLAHLSQPAGGEGGLRPPRGILRLGVPFPLPPAPGEPPARRGAGEH